MRERIIAQLQDVLRDQLTISESFEMALQILVWVKLSSEGGLPENITLNDALINNPGAATFALNELSRLHPEAFMNNRFNQVDQRAQNSAFDLAVRLAETGVLRGFDAKDAITDAAQQERLVSAIPSGLADLVVHLARIKAGQSAYIGWDHGGQLASRVASLDAVTYLETPRRSPIPALISLLSPKKYEVAYSDPITAPSAVSNGKPKKFDVALGFPPLGIRYEPDVIAKDWFGRFPERKASSAVLTLRQLMSQSDERVVAVVQNNLLFSGGVEYDLRQDLLGKGQIEAVIALPSGFLYQTNVPVAVLVLAPKGGHQSIKFINADSDRFRVRDGNSRTRHRLVNVEELLRLLVEPDETPDSIQVPTEEVIGNDCLLQVNRYVLPGVGRALQERMAGEKTEPLGALVNVLRPLPIRPANPGPVSASEISMADIPDHGHILSASREVMVDERMLTRYEPLFLRPYDIVLMVKGSIGRVGIISTDAPPPGPGGWVANQSALILRSEGKAALDPRALYIILRSELGKALLDSITTQATIAIIQLAELMQLEVPVPAPGEQERAIEVLGQEADLQKEIEALREQQSRLAADLWTFQA
jgi:type I restriction enzyme M protein